VKSLPPALRLPSALEIIPSVIAPSAMMVAMPIPIPMIASNALLLFLKGFFIIKDKNDMLSLIFS
jgi:hypothetical protein